MDAILGPLAALAGDGALIPALMAASGLGLLGVLASGVLRGRRDVRRRAAEGAGAAAAPLPGRGGVDPARALQGLTAAFERQLAGGDERQTKLLRQQLMQAGFFDPRAMGVFLAARLALGAALVPAGILLLPFVLGGQAGTTLWLLVAALGGVGYFLPSIYLKRRIGARADAHRKGFPDFMDLMVVCAEAGLSMEAAIERIARELVEGYPSLAENLYMASLEIRAGKPFGEALERMGHRLGIEEAVMLATLLQQSAELGTSLSQSLRIYSEEMRNKRMSRAEEKAYALPALLVIPLTLFVFPILIVVLLYPAIIRVMNAF